MIFTGLGDYKLDGGSGDDLPIADYPHRFARGNDTLIGGEGNDKLDGGKGADEFVFFLGETGNDTIAQFDKMAHCLVRGLRLVRTKFI